MADKLKHIFFTKDSINQLADYISITYSEFERNKFVKLIYDDHWESLELKAKMRHVAICLHTCLPRDYKKSIEILTEIAPFIKGFEGMVFPDFVELYGLDYWEISLKALKEFTKYSSSEFAIRPFILKDKNYVIKYLLELATNENENVRRFASEGCRPRLPWAMALPEFKKDPTPIIPVLELLKDDESDFVRRSVANNLNDISKDHPEIVLELCKKWIGNSERTDWIIKHGCRTLLKAGNKKALMLFGYQDPGQIKIEKLKLEKSKIKIGDYLSFSFAMKIQGKKQTKIRIEYAIDYLKANNTHNRKVFKITENKYSPGEKHLTKKHSFVEMTTRKHYVGLHKVSILINGQVKETKAFEVYE
jgi:3-methyladenine DNA glycosylase AlkC